MFKRISAALAILLRGVPEQPKPPVVESLDPLAVLHRTRRSRTGSLEADEPISLRSAMDDVIKVEREAAGKFAHDAAVSRKDFVGDSTGPKTPGNGQFGIPESLQNWYISQSFIGWQSCAIIAQHWLIDKACSRAGEDAVRHGWDLNIVRQNAEGATKDPDAVGGEEQGGLEAGEADDEVIDRIKEIDTDFKIKKHCSNLAKFTNVFGIRIAIYEVDYDDPKAYEKPFNLDGVKKGSYRGIRQVDPYWTAPILDSEAAADPTSLRFYVPTWWVIGGRRYHYTHLHISLGPEVSDILKPQYYYGGLPLTQRIYERVYAAERTANEAPLLAMSKRTTALHVDLKKVAANQTEFENRLSQWIAYRDNHCVKVLGIEEQMEESDTSLTDFDSVIMGQYQLVASIAGVPATKLLETSPKGFNATGEFEEKSYHESLETIQSDDYDPFLTRHYELLCKSEGYDFRVEIAWNPTDAKTAEQQAEINLKKAQTGETLINGGAISPDEERRRVREDKNSGYSSICDNEEASTEFADAGGEEPPPGGGEGSQPNQEDEHLFGSASGMAPAAKSSDEVVTALSGLLAQLKSLKKSPGSLPRGLVRPSVRKTAKPKVVPTVKSELRGDRGKADEADLAKKPWGGYTVAIENPAGSYRSGHSQDGKQWSSQMPADYGYLIGTKGADGHGIDVFMGPVDGAIHVYIVNQNNPSTGAFDEHKVMIGYNSVEDAEAIYHSAYSQDWKGFGDIHQVHRSDFRDWVASGNTSLPYTSDWRVEGQTANSHEPIIK